MVNRVEDYFQLEMSELIGRQDTEKTWIKYFMIKQASQVWMFSSKELAVLLGTSENNIGASHRTIRKLEQTDKQFRETMQRYRDEFVMLI